MKRLLQSICLILVTLVNVYSEDIHVPGDYPTIQQAINASRDGDSVIVEPGMYEENPSFHGKAIHVRSAQGAETTIINGMKNDSVVKFMNSETENTVLEGFTLANGVGYSIGGTTYGGGVYLDNECRPVLKSLIIRNNRANRGGGVYGTYASPTLEHCSIFFNSTAYWGGGIFCDAGSEMKLMFCTIRENEADSKGGGIYSKGATPMILNCIISFNRAPRGGGIYTLAGGNVVVANTNVVMNRASSNGSALYCDASTTVTNSIFWNFPSNGDDEIHLTNNANLQWTYTAVKGGWPGTGNIETSPEFLYTYEQDFHIISSSPCVDAGDDESIYLLEYDFDGDPRIVNGRVDIGADEFTTPHGSPGEYYIPDDYSTIQDGIDGSYPGDVIIVRPGTYLENPDFKGRPITVKSEEGPGRTVIDGQGDLVDNRPVVKFMFLEQADSVLQGFTLTNGSGYMEPEDGTSYGGAVYCEEAEPTLLDLVIENNKANNGGGIYCRSGVSKVSGCTFSANEATKGGGIYMLGGGLIENCTIEDNPDGGGIFASTKDDLTIRNNTIKNNKQRPGIECSGVGKFHIENNVILNNVSSESGGGICLIGGTSNTVRNNKIVGNHASQGGGSIQIAAMSSLPITSLPAISSKAREEVLNVDSGAS